MTSNMRHSLSVQPQPFHKTYVTLSDYDYSRDIALRTLIATLQPQDILILEEILYSPLQFPIEVLCTNLHLSQDIVDASLTKLQETNLFTRQHGQLVVCKEMRKHLELQIDPLDPDFRPDLTYMQQLLKKVPIEVLPTWYHISRASHQIFESIIEKYLKTPQLYKRYLREQLSGNHMLHQLLDTVFASPSLRVSLQYLQTHFNLSCEELHEYILLLEFNFLGCLCSEVTEEGIEQYITPFAEWRDYLLFQQQNAPESITESVMPLRPTEYAFCDDLAHLLKGSPLPLQSIAPLSLAQETYQSLCKTLKGEPPPQTYVHQLLEQGLKLSLADIHQMEWIPAPQAIEWTACAPNMRAHFTYRHPNTLALYENTNTYRPIEKLLLDLERALAHIADAEWIYVDAFLNSAPLALKESDTIQLRRIKHTWQYHRPHYTSEDREYLKILITEYLYMTGIVHLGKTEHGLCFMLTHLGKTCFASNGEPET